jgi:hypothetical protein
VFCCCLVISFSLRPISVIVQSRWLAEGKLKKAEEFLIAAYWNFLKFSKPEEKKEGEEDSKVNQDDISEEYEFNAIFSEIVSYRGTLHKTFSKLFLAQVKHFVDSHRKTTRRH